MHDNLQFAATLTAILGGILFSRQDTRRMDAKIDAKIDAMRAEIHRDISDLRNEFTRKTDSIVAMLFDHSERITKVKVGKQDKP